MKAFQIQQPGSASIIDVPEPTPQAPGEVLLRVNLIGMCGSDLSTFSGRNPMVSFPRIPGHEVAATVASDAPDLPAGTRVTVSPYTSCGACASCRRGRPNACQFNQTMGVQRDGAMREYVTVPRERLYTAGGSLERSLASLPRLQ